jgi:hypothetical protein
MKTKLTPPQVQTLKFISGIVEEGPSSFFGSVKALRRLELIETYSEGGFLKNKLTEAGRAALEALV